MKEYTLTTLDVEAIMFAIAKEFIEKGDALREDPELVLASMALITKRITSHLDGSNPLPEERLSAYKTKTMLIRLMMEGGRTQ